MTEVKQMKVYSTLMLGDGAIGRQSLFTIPQGMHMASLGACTTIPQTAEHTNIRCAGELGVAIGDAMLKSVHATTSDGSKVDADVALVISGETVFAGRLSDLLAGPVTLKGGGVPVARTDSFEVKVDITEALKRSGDPVLVQITFDSLVMMS